MSKVFKFSKNLRELRIHLCQTSSESAGVRNFIGKHYVQLKKENPSTPVLVRECSGVQPKLWARYDFGRETSLPLSDYNDEQVLKAVEKLAK
jgi:NADH dehydrogenase (ubiquinone) 1 alpha subcomplex subunit 2